MVRKSTRSRKFATEPQEADWYATPAGRRLTIREFARALRSGSVDRSTGLRAAKTNPKVLEELMSRAKESATRAISLRVSVTDLERAKRIAVSTGVGYQTVLKQAIRVGLTRT